MVLCLTLNVKSRSLIHLFLHTQLTQALRFSSPSTPTEGDSGKYTREKCPFSVEIKVGVHSFGFTGEVCAVYYNYHTLINVIRG